jgi:trk system potassium uptake protein TrkA
MYHVPKVMTRINDPIRADAYRRMGIVTICGTTILAGLMRDFVNTDQWLLEKDYNKEYVTQNF